MTANRDADQKTNQQRLRIVMPGDPQQLRRLCDRLFLPPFGQ